MHDHCTVIMVHSCMNMPSMPVTGIRHLYRPTTMQFLGNSPIFVCSGSHADIGRGSHSSELMESLHNPIALDDQGVHHQEDRHPL